MLNAKQYLHQEAIAGLLLMGMALCALLIDNSPLAWLYQQSLAYSLAHHSLQHWINHGLMTLFFITIGIEIKREIVSGELNSRAKATLPLVAALGGMMVPALLYVAITFHHPGLGRGWAIPMATDIAFSLGLLQLSGQRCPVALKVFLMTLATFDDLGAIAVIALFYSHDIHTSMLTVAVALSGVLFLLHHYRCQRLSLYGFLAVALWYCTSQAGIDAAISGIIVAFSLPAGALAEKTIKLLQPWVTYGVLPLFAFANAGVPLLEINRNIWSNGLLLGIVVGLLIGKPLGVLTFSWLSLRCRLTALPKGLSWRHLIGVALLCGIGFTMSLFIGELAFEDIVASHAYRLGILSASCLAGLLGFYWLKRL